MQSQKKSFTQARRFPIHSYCAAEATFKCTCWFWSSTTWQLKSRVLQPTCSWIDWRVELFECEDDMFHLFRQYLKTAGELNIFSIDQRQTMNTKQDCMWSSTDWISLWFFARSIEMLKHISQSRVGLCYTNSLKRVDPLHSGRRSPWLILYTAGMFVDESSWAFFRIWTVHWRARETTTKTWMALHYGISVLRWMQMFPDSSRSLSPDARSSTDRSKFEHVVSERVHNHDIIQIVAAELISEETKLMNWRLSNARRRPLNVQLKKIRMVLLLHTTPSSSLPGCRLCDEVFLDHWAFCSEGGFHCFRWHASGRGTKSKVVGHFQFRKVGTFSRTKSFPKGDDSSSRPSASSGKQWSYERLSSTIWQMAHHSICELYLIMSCWLGPVSFPSENNDGIWNMCLIFW